MQRETLELVDKLLEDGLDYMQTAYPHKETNPYKMIEGTGFLIALYRLFTPMDEEMQKQLEYIIEFRRLKAGELILKECEVNK